MIGRLGHCVGGECSHTFQAISRNNHSPDTGMNERGQFQRCLRQEEAAPPDSPEAGGAGLRRPGKAIDGAVGRGQGLMRSVVEKIGRAIVGGELAADDFTTEGESARRLGVSRNLLREAVKILTAKGLLTARPRHGTSVEPEGRWNLLDPDIMRWMLGREISVELMISFTEVRLAAEPIAAWLAASRFDRTAYDGVAKAVERIEHAASGRGDLVTSDVAFHVAVLDASGNPFFRQLSALVETAVRATIELTWEARASAQALHRYDRIADAIFIHDATAAHEAMRALVSDNLAILKALRASRHEGEEQALRPARATGLRGRSANPVPEPAASQTQAPRQRRQSAVS
ncbi:FadR/GntR family transcriptional regulator [Phenylobacterium montanum]|uniref:FadR family transcriptional regulator n=1 Tax=Phenylobacterium montanum TaxID=2823693 RepID=A0A975G4B7_9CAUL|nr:FCD domain-containing protein [Caulobacter sp. S6]QUD90337.1 FadR family transcriptional regulator [Caulobacter sp. S6]